MLAHTRTLPRASSTEQLFRELVKLCFITLSTFATEHSVAVKFHFQVLGDFEWDIQSVVSMLDTFMDTKDHFLARHGWWLKLCDGRYSLKCCGDDCDFGMLRYQEEHFSSLDAVYKALQNAFPNVDLKLCNSARIHFERTLFTNGVTLDEMGFDSKIYQVFSICLESPSTTNDLARQLKELLDKIAGDVSLCPCRSKILQWLTPTNLLKLLVEAKKISSAVLEWDPRLVDAPKDPPKFAVFSDCQHVWSHKLNCYVPTATASERESVVPFPSICYEDMPSDSDDPDIDFLERTLEPSC
jgi:hypothetical protein